MNQVVKMTSPAEDFVAKVLDPPHMAEIVRELPAHIKPALFQRNLFHAVTANPDLMNYAPGLVFREVSKAVSLGLLLDPQLGEAYIVIAYNYKTRQKEPQLRPGYRGLIKLARQSGDVKMIYAHEVCANDAIECELGIDRRLIHKPAIFGERGKIIGYYAVVKFGNGDADFEPMSVGQIHAIRDRTDAYKAFKDGAIKSTPWATDEAEMAKKTVIRRLLKRTSQSPELAEAIRLDDANEYPPRPPGATPSHAAIATAPARRTPPAPPPAPVHAIAPPQPNAAPEPPQPSHETVMKIDMLALKLALSAATDLDTINDRYEEWFAPREAHMSQNEIDECNAILREAAEPYFSEATQ